MSIYKVDIPPLQFLYRIQKFFHLDFFRRISPYSRVTLLVKIDTQGEKNLAYQPGDHVSIFPANDMNLVEALLNKLHNAPEPDKPITIQSCTVESGIYLYFSSFKCRTDKWIFTQI